MLAFVHSGKDSPMRERRIYLGLGTNLGDRIEALRAALRALAQFMTVEAVSSVWDTAPEIVKNQPRFLNAAVSGMTTLDPFALLGAIKRLEWDMGRRPAGRYGPRPIDVDILLYDAWCVDSRELMIPHPLLAERAFVLAPLAQIAPTERHPALGATIGDLQARMPPADIRRLELSLA